jgi:uncharacterized protein
VDFERKELPFEYKEASDDGSSFSGYASVFCNVDRTGEVIAPGAFDDSLPRFLEEGVIAWNHDWGLPIGRPVEAREDRRGLYIKAFISDTQMGRDARTLLKDRVVKKLSIGFRTVASEVLNEKAVGELWETHGYQPTPEDRHLLKAAQGARVLREIDLYEASPVSVPANRQADITAVKSFLEAGRADQEQRQQEARQAYARFQQTRFRFTSSRGE